MPSREERPTIKSLIEFQRQLIESKNPFVRRFGALLAAGALDEHLSELRDQQIAQLMLDVIGCDLRIAAPETTICDQAIKRLFRSTGERLEEVESEAFTCPKCGNDMLFHFGIDESDFFQCVLVGCEYKEFAADPEDDE